MTITNPTAQVHEQPDAESIATDGESPLVAVLRAVQDVVTMHKSIHDEWRIEEPDPTDEQYAEMRARLQIVEQLQEVLGQFGNVSLAPTSPDIPDRCPGCGDLIVGHGARSRVDDDTRICTPCSRNEALADLAGRGVVWPGIARSDSGLWALHLGVRLEHLPRVGAAIVYWREVEDLGASLYLDDPEGDGWTTWGQPAGQGDNQPGVYRLTCDGGETPEPIVNFLAWFFRAYPSGELLVDLPDSRPGLRTDLGRPIAMLTDQLNHAADAVVVYQHPDGIRTARPRR